MKQRNQHIERRPSTTSQRAGRSLTSRGVICAASYLLCIAGPTITLISADVLAGQSLLGITTGALLTLAGIVGITATEKNPEPVQATGNSHKDATRAPSTKMIEGGVMTPRTTVLNSNNYNEDGRKIADNHALLRTQRKAIMSNIPH